MTFRVAPIAIGLVIFPGAGPAASAATPAPSRALGADVTYSTDADSTDVVRLGTNLDPVYQGPNHYLGIRLERIAYRPSGQHRTIDARAYIRAANKIGNWTYHATVGTNGDTILGSGSINDESRFRKELFVERDKVETPLGVTRPIYYTFGGAAIDLPLAPHTQLTLLGGLQDFTGHNVREHLRANFIQMLKENWGLTGQVRARYFRNSDPGEYDYYSPRDYVEILPLVQMRRFRGGWQYLAAAGWGGQHASGSNWRQSRYLDFKLSSPASRRGWIVNGEVVYSNTPISNRNTYDYLRTSLGLTRAF